MYRIIIGGTVAIAALVAFIVVEAQSAPVRPSLSCATSGEKEVALRVLVYGESWAAGGRLLPEMPRRLAARTGKTVRVCTLGYSGQNTAKLLQHDALAISRAALGGVPHHVVILNGVNDQIQHIGPRAYVEQTLKLMHKFPGVHVHTMAPPIVRTDPPLPAMVKARYWFAGVQNPEGNDSYLVEIDRKTSDKELIYFRPFSAGSIVEPGRYAVDGIHLTTAQFHAYGDYIGQTMPLE